MADLYEKLKRFQQATTSSISPKPENPSASSDISFSSRSSLPDSLFLLPGLSRARDLISHIEKRDAEKKQFLADIGVEEAVNKAGAYGYREIILPPHELGYRPEDLTPTEMALQTRDEAFLEIVPGRILFLDTETTGLAGGTGTVPFLVGTGSFEKEGFRIRQYLMRDYDEEPAVLQALEEASRPFQAVATYNGKCFDIPLLNSRFLLNRLRPRLSGLPHADFLYPARRFWRGMLPDCSLITVESRIFGRTRIDDIPGEQIPYVYFDFLRGQRLQRMRPVLNHNAEDIVTLAKIAARTCRMLRDPFHETGHSMELAGVGRFFAAIGDRERACVCWDHVRKNGNLPRRHLNEVCRNLTLLYKKMERYPEARDIWLEMAETTNDLHAYIELAKYYEHKVQDLAEALRLTDEVLTLLDGLEDTDVGYSIKHEIVNQELLHRRQRLIRKLKSACE